jgi:phage head maturation protease
VTITLYEDQEPPLVLAGYAATWLTAYRADGRLERIARNGIDHRRHQVALCVEHDPGIQLATQRDKSLELWNDAHGLAFRAVLPSRLGMLPIARAVATGGLDGVSIHWPGGGLPRARLDQVDGREILTVESVAIDEVSLCYSPANASTLAWIETAPEEDHPPHVQAARARWRHGRAEHQVARMRAQEPKRPDAAAVAIPDRATMAKIGRVIASARPDLAEFWR